MNKWDDEGKDSLWLFTENEFHRLPDGIVLECIDGDKVTKGVDEIDMDTRFGHIAFGVRHPFEHEYRNLFLTFVLSQ